MNCCFIGHRDCVGIEKEIYMQIEKLMRHKDILFYSGGMGNFDKLCEKAVKDLGGKIVFVPYNIKQIKEKDKRWYDHIVCPFGDKPYSKFDIPKRNQWLVDQCNICLCYVYKEGGAQKTLEYALSKKKQIIYL